MKNSHTDNRKLMPYLFCSLFIGHHIQAQEQFLKEQINAFDPAATFIKATDFSYDSHHFSALEDGMTLRAIKQSGDLFYNFNGDTGQYDVVLFSIGENVGRSRHIFTQNEKEFGAFLTALSTKDFDDSPMFLQVVSNAKLEQGQTIKARVTTGSRDQKKYTEARFKGIAIMTKGKGEPFLNHLKKLKAMKTPFKLSGELKKWHKVTLTFDGPKSAEDADFNPFMHYRFNVAFTHKASGKSYLVPGYFAADGNAGETSATSGNKWRAHFAPDEIGEWEFKVDFRRGTFAAVSTMAKTGVSAGFMDGYKGSFNIDSTDKTGRDFRAKGRLQYVGERYLKFAETKEYFLKQGPDAPENFLAYVDFDGTFHNDGHKDNLVKTWEPHLQDWKSGDPQWKNGKGKGIIGALNYLASEELNSVSFLTNNIAGDDQNVFPYVDYNTYDRFDVSKLEQWEIVFTHAQYLGLFLHFKTLEVENQGLLDNGGVGAMTKLYYRELIARFGHHLALNWNLGEENGEWVIDNRTPPQHTPERLAMANYFKEHDPYHHHLVIHNGVNYDDFLGMDSGLTGPSVQTHRADFSIVHKEVLHWLEVSEKAGQIWAVAVDEPGDAQHSLLPDEEDPDHDLARKNALWGTLMAGGWGDEWYFGYAHAHSDLSCQDYRSRDLWWDQTRTALLFFRNNNIPFYEMENHNALVGNEENLNTIYCLAKPNETYLIFKNNTDTVEIDLSKDKGEFKVDWFNPKTGGKLQQMRMKKVTAGQKVDLGNPPNKKQKDWVVLLRKI